MTVIFKEMLEDIVECNVDDLVVEPHQRIDHIKHHRPYSTSYVTPCR